MTFNKLNDEHVMIIIRSSTGWDRRLGDLTRPRSPLALALSPWGGSIGTSREKVKRVGLGETLGEAHLMADVSVFTRYTAGAVRIAYLEI